MGYLGNQITTVFPTSISVDSATISGNTTIGGTLGVTGATTLSNQLTDANMSVGSVIQIINASTTSEVSTTGTSFVDSGVTATITPSSTSSKILVLFTQHQFISGAAGESRIKLLRGSTDLLTTGYMVFSSHTSVMAQGTHHYLDSPSTTSATTYKVQFNSVDGSNVLCNYDDSAGDASSFMTLMEIAQ